MNPTLYKNWTMVPICLLSEDEIKWNWAIDQECIEKMSEVYCEMLKDVIFVMEVDHITLKFFIKDDRDAVEFKLKHR